MNTKRTENQQVTRRSEKTYNYVTLNIFILEKSTVQVETRSKNKYYYCVNLNDFTLYINQFTYTQNKICLVPESFNFLYYD